MVSVFLVLTSLHNTHRFSFCPEGSENPVLCNQPKEDEKEHLANDMSKDQPTETSSLIGDGSQLGSKESLRNSEKDKTSLKNSETSSARNSADDPNPPYINLVSHGCDYVNM